MLSCPTANAAKPAPLPEFHNSPTTLSKVQEKIKSFSSSALCLRQVHSIHLHSVQVVRTSLSFPSFRLLSFLQPQHPTARAAHSFHKHSIPLIRCTIVCIITVSFNSTLQTLQHLHSICFFSCYADDMCIPHFPHPMFIPFNPCTCFNPIIIP